MKFRRNTALAAMVALLSGCGGDGGGGASGGSVPVATAPTPAPTTTTAGTCSLRDRQDWAAAQLREWYLFPESDDEVQA